MARLCRNDRTRSLKKPDHNANPPSCVSHSLRFSMAPPLNSIDLLSKRSTNDPNTTLLIISGIIGGASIVISAIILIVVVVKRRSSVTLRHSRNLSDDSATSLLQPKPQWRNQPFIPPLDHSLLPSDKIHSNNSTDSLATILPSQREEVEPQFTEVIPLLSSDLPAPEPALTPKPTLPSLSIPSYFQHSMTAPSPGSGSSQSLYSQPSASTSHVASPVERKPTPVRLSAPLVPQDAYIRPDTANVPTRTNTHRIGKLLKERAKRNERKSTRSTSRIERAGSIKTAFDSDDSDDDSESAHRHRLFDTKSSFGATQEWSNISLTTK
ncbi:hypothetical protein H2248_004288 [Termitomyces sp. 'cryptogamus']|nr:hypothetical protein H2248_004288 [Termitomyces sp. 'cryptogamus']